MRRPVPPLVDKDWHAICQAIFRGVEEAAKENLYHKFVEMNKDASGSGRAKTLAYLDQTSEEKIVHRDAVRQEIVEQTLEEPGAGVA